MHWKLNKLSPLSKCHLAGRTVWVGQFWTCEIHQRTIDHEVSFKYSKILTLLSMETKSVFLAESGFEIWFIETIASSYWHFFDLEQKKKKRPYGLWRNLCSRILLYFLYTVILLCCKIFILNLSCAKFKLKESLNTRKYSCWKRVVIHFFFT